MIGDALCKRSWAMVGSTVVVMGGLATCPLHVSAPLLTVIMMFQTWLIFHRKECCHEAAVKQARAA